MTAKEARITSNNNAIVIETSELTKYTNAIEKTAKAGNYSIYCLPLPHSDETLKHLLLIGYTLSWCKEGLYISW